MRFRAGQSVLLGACLSVLGASHTMAQEMTEGEAVQRFERENAQVRALAARVREVRAEFRAFSLAPNPSVTYTREDSAGTRDDFLLVHQALPVTGRLGLLRRAGDSATSAAQANTDYSLLLLRSEFRMSFHTLLLAQEREAHTAKAVSDLQEILRILRDREREGEGSAFDRLRAERELADAQVNLASAQVLLAQARSRLAAMLAPGTDPATLKARGEIAGGGSLPSVQDLLTRALEKRGDLTARSSYPRRSRSSLRAVRSPRFSSARVRRSWTDGSDPPPAISPRALSVAGSVPGASMAASRERACASSACARARFTCASANSRSARSRSKAEPSPSRSRSRRMRRISCKSLTALAVCASRSCASSSVWNDMRNSLRSKRSE